MARCVAGGLLKSYPLMQLFDPKFRANDPAVQAKVGEPPPTAAVDGALGGIAFTLLL